MPRISNDARLTRLTIVATLLLAASPLWAQPRRDSEETLKPPSMQELGKTDQQITTILIGLGLFGALLGVNLIPSKRGHQD